jgi:DNA-binding CsgD family transcriptional regulator
MVPHHLAPCWFTLDPQSLLITSHVDAVIPEIPHEWLTHEYYNDDVLKVADVARSKPGLATLHEVTNDNPQASPGWRQFVAPYGGDQQLLLALRGRGGAPWGMLALYRNGDQPRFTDRERQFLVRIAASLGEGARRALLMGEALEPDQVHAPDGEGADPHGPGLVVLDDGWAVESLTPDAEHWLAEMPDSSWRTTRTLPTAVLAVASRAMRSKIGMDSPGEVAVARARTASGRWLRLHGAPLVSAAGRRVAVIVEPADAADIAPLLMSMYELSEREQAVTRLVLQGESTDAIARQLWLSPHTVQQHLKSIFAKTGVQSRRDLVGKIFFTHYEPRVRDNEERAATGRPLRGGPYRG